MRRYITGSLIFIFCINQCFCQDAARFRKDSIYLHKKVGSILIVPDTNERFAGQLRLPFSSIKIEDVRFDTTQICMYNVFTDAFLPSFKNYKINFKDGVSSSLNSYFNNFFKANFSNEDKGIVCFIKKLNLIKTDTITENLSLERSYGQVNFQVEVFLRSGKEFYTAFKIDTILVESIGIRKKEIADDIKDFLLMPALALLQNKISNTDWQKIQVKKSFAESIVYDNYFQRRFDIPILTQPCKRGIYKSFAEFKNNTPSVTDFKVKTGKLPSVSLIDNNGDYVVTIKMFGFCDGERCWILAGNFYFPLIRTGNGFEFFFILPTGLRILSAVDLDNQNISF